MKYFLFLPRFEAPIRAGVKRQTIRGARAKGTPRAGELVSLRRWTVQAYRSPQLAIGTAPIAAVLPIAVDLVDGLRVAVAGEELAGEDLDAFAVGDGFADAGDLAEYWAREGIKTFDGFVYQWADFQPAK